MNVSAFLSDTAAVGLCINCFVLSLWHHVSATNIDASFCFYRHKQILSHGWICFVGESNRTHHININVRAFLLLLLICYLSVKSRHQNQK